MHYSQIPLDQQNQQFSASPDLIPANELKIKYRKLNPYTSDEINVLLLENISEKAVRVFKDAGFNVKFSDMKLTRSVIYFIRWNVAKKHYPLKN